MDETSEAKEKISSSDQYLSTKKLNKNLKTRTIQGAAVTMTAQLGKLFLTLVSTAILARQLTPEDFGLLGMVTVITGFISIFSDLGLSAATIQRENINHQQVSALFWCNALLGLLIMLLTIGLAPVLAWFYQEPRILLITIVLSSGFLINGLSVQHKAILKRQMQFRQLSTLEIVSILVGIVVAIVVAYYDGRYWAIVSQQIVTHLVSTSLAWFLCTWRPGYIFKDSELSELLSFGGNLSGFSILNYFVRNGDNFLIGRYWGASELGLYAKAYQILLLPIRQINAPMSSVFIPLLSRLQNDPVNYKKSYLRAISFMAYVTTPIIAVLAASSTEIVLVFFGEQWKAAGTIFKILAIAALGQPLANTVGWIYISLGRTARMRTWGLISSPVFIFAFLCGLPWKSVGVALAYAICVHTLRIPMLAFAFRKSPIKLTDFLKTCLRPTLIGLVVYVTSSVMNQTLIQSEEPFQRLLLSTTIGIFSGITMVGIWKSSRREVSESLSLISRQWSSQIS